MSKLTRRDFLKVGAIGVGGVLLSKIYPAAAFLPDFPISPRLGRVFNLVEIKSRPDPESETVDIKYDDNILEIKREMVGKAPSLYSKSRLWYEVPGGFIPAITVQPVKAELNTPLGELPVFGTEPGMWAEVTVPYVDIELANPPARSLLDSCRTDAKQVNTSGPEQRPNPGASPKPGLGILSTAQGLQKISP
jgi:hypothetical protein